MKNSMLWAMNLCTACVVSASPCNFQIIGKNPKIYNFFFDEKSWKIFGMPTRLHAPPASSKTVANIIILWNIYYVVCNRNTRDLLGIYDDLKVFKLFSSKKNLLISGFFPMI